MNITFLIGNGFDINLGLKTRYKEFYEYYSKLGLDDMLSNSIGNDYELWADLETGLGEFLKNIDKDEIDDFLDSKELLEQHLQTYLKSEEERFFIKDEKALLVELKSKVSQFYKEFSLIEKETYTDYLLHEINRICFRFINFNYTSTLERIINTKENDNIPFSSHRLSDSTVINDTIDNPLYVHGKLDNGIIIGINDREQINNDQLKDDYYLNKYMIKSSLNKQIGEKRQTTGFQYINNSRYVCVFGLSLGDTDNIWWCHIIKWLLSNEKNRLVLYVYDKTDIQNASAMRQVRFSDRNTRKIINKENTLDDTKKRIIEERTIIIPNSSIFSFKNVGVNENDQTQNADS